MGTVILLRHGRSSANSSGVLAGRAPKVGLDETGRAQAEALVQRLAGIPVAAVVSSPLLRCRQTVAPLLADRGLSRITDSRLSEVDYGEWTGRELKSLAKEPLWKVVQLHPSAAVFPGGEGLAAMQARAVSAVRDHDARITGEHGEHAVWVACTHGDVIKAVLADALGQHLDAFQRIVIDPGSVSVVRYTETRPFVLRVNDNGGDLAGIVPPKPKRRRRGTLSSDADVGGTTGRKDRP
ncbi:histidine phosphatase family protein [Saccharomonospora viridis]|uniref:Phosphoglycerate mutase n=1 Tax=Saccharomonospora viridis TaxID=1852 RepID=A0A837D7Q1_9PSEU|nr:histidine phosphatase family protein [Saccharomonospora viridis]KHF43245.1 phosphoglycerate mutase [Saccharomonospora viridis]SFO82074.1 probable phosphomutase, MSMEG_4193 family [Saccharomonospora viridis]